MKNGFSVLKRAIALVLCLALALMLGGCAGTKETAAGTASKYDWRAADLGTEAVVLNIAMDQGSSPGLDALAEAFHEAYPNVSINIYNMGWADLADKVSNPGGTDPVDGFMVSYRQKVWLEMYSSVWQERCEDFAETDIVDLSAWNKELLDSVTTADGKIYALPLTTGTVGMMCNMDLLAACGIDHAPTTTEELLADCALIAQKGYQPFRCEALNMAYLVEGMTAWELTKEGKTADFTAALLSATDGMDAAAYMAPAITLLEAIQENGWLDTTSLVFNPEANSGEGGEKAISSYKEDCYAFLNGDVAFFPTYPDLLSSLQKRESRLQKYLDAPFTYAFIPVPTKYGASPERTAAYSLFACKESKNLAWMNKFLQFVFYRESDQSVGNAAIFSDAQFCMSPFDTDKVYTETSHKYYAAFHTLFAEGTSCAGDWQPLLAYNGYGVFRGCILRALRDEGALDSAASAETLTARFADAIKRWYADKDVWTE